MALATCCILLRVARIESAPTTIVEPCRPRSREARSGPSCSFHRPAPSPSLAPFSNAVTPTQKVVVRHGSSTGGVRGEGFGTDVSEDGSLRGHARGEKTQLYTCSEVMAQLALSCVDALLPTDKSALHQHPQRHHLINHELDSTNRRSIVTFYRTITSHVIL